MLPKQYHAILFICILVMLLLLGLHLLGIGYSSGQAAAKSAALARNSSQTTSSSNVNTALSSSQAYRHPIVYDKLTGATNNQINDVLGAGKAPLSDYPIDHYQQQQQQQQSSQQLPFNQLPQDDFFNSIHRQGGAGFPPMSHPAHHMHLPMGPPGMQIPPPMMTTQTPTLRPQSPSPPQPPRQHLQLGHPLLPPMAPPPPPPPIARPPNPNEISPTGSSAAQGSQDSLPSASSLNNNGQQARPSSTLNSTTNQQHLQQQAAQPIYPQQQQPQQQTYYTPPIFAYNNFDQNRPLVDPQLALPYGFPQQPQQPQQPPLGVPEAPLSIDEYQARQARLRAPGQQQLQAPNEVSQIDRYGKPAAAARVQAALGQEPQFVVQQQQQQPNLLADPQQQQRHKQQMLDRNQLLFGGYAPDANNNNNQSQSYYPDSATIGYRPYLSSPPNSIRPPYAHSMSPPPPPSSSAAPQNRATTNNKLDTSSGQQQAKLLASERAPKQQQPPPGAQQALVNFGQVPTCARQQVASNAANETSLSNTNASTNLQQLPTLFCQEDSEYPTKEIMRALESYANERSIEQLLPQPLVQIHLAAQRNLDKNGRQVTLDSLQHSIAGPMLSKGEQADQPASLFQSAIYDPLCRSNVYMAQPRRAKNLLGQWKVVVNLPGHKYRGIAISQMLRIEECSRPNGECNLRDTLPPPPPPPAASGRLGLPGPQVSQLASRSRCLQQYENQRLVAWSHQQGLHVDIFRVPIACSCHIRR